VDVVCVCVCLHIFDARLTRKEKARGVDVRKERKANTDHTGADKVKGKLKTSRKQFDSEAKLTRRGACHHSTSTFHMLRHTNNAAARSATVNEQPIGHDQRSEISAVVQSKVSNSEQAPAAVSIGSFLFPGFNKPLPADHDTGSVGISNFTSPLAATVAPATSLCLRPDHLTQTQLLSTFNFLLRTPSLLDEAQSSRARQYAAKRNLRYLVPNATRLS